MRAGKEKKRTESSVFLCITVTRRSPQGKDNISDWRGAWRPHLPKWNTGSCKIQVLAPTFSLLMATSIAWEKSEQGPLTTNQYVRSWCEHSISEASPKSVARTDPDLTKFHLQKTSGKWLMSVNIRKSIGIRLLAEIKLTWSLLSCAIWKGVCLGRSGRSCIWLYKAWILNATFRTDNSGR